MVKSMTGYGVATLQIEAERSYTVEIKSVNHRYCDVHVKLPNKLSLLEPEIKKIVKDRFERGRFDVYISLDEFGAATKQISFDQQLAAEYLRQLQSLGAALGLETSIDVLSLTRMPDVLQVKQAELDQQQMDMEIQHAMSEALDHLEQMRTHEGHVLEEDIRANLTQISRFVTAIASCAETTPAQYKAVLEERIKRLTENVIELDQERLIQEVALFADRIDISEELTRLQGHIDHFLHFLQSQDAIGKKLDFLVQEMNREINTIGSKANNSEISKQVVEVKSILEKIREQIQNIE